MRSKHKEPSLLRQFISIHYEQAQRRKAIHNLAKAQWSFEYLTEVVRQASISLRRDVEIEVETPGNRIIRIKNTRNVSQLSDDDDIFNKLDDDAAIERFIAAHAPRRG